MWNETPEMQDQLKNHGWIVAQQLVEAEILLCLNLDKTFSDKTSKNKKHSFFIYT